MKISEEELAEKIQGQKDIDAFMQQAYPEYMADTYYDESYDELFPVINLINAMGREFNFIIYKNYVSLTVEKENKFYKDFKYAHAEYITAEQDGKKACFKLILNFLAAKENF